jgi:vacuolar-type H+-ATPase subunit H
MVKPAVVEKQPDGTYVVRIQHTEGGDVSQVSFGHWTFGESLANAYAAFINGASNIDSKIDKLASEMEAAAPDAKADIKKATELAQDQAKVIIADAKVEADKLVAAAKEEIVKVTANAEAFYEDTKNEARQLLTEARSEAAKILAKAAEAVKPLVPDPVPFPTKPTKPSKSTKPEIDEE